MGRVPAIAMALLLAGLGAATPWAQTSQGAAAIGSDEPSVPAAATLVYDATRFVKATNPQRLDVLQALLRAHGLRATILPFANDQTARDPRPNGSNVVVDVGTGSADIIIGAHVDAVRLPDGSLSGAVVDNAAAVVVLERLAETLQRTSLQHRVRIVFFDMEELGLVGSRRFVETLDTPRVAAMVNIDIAGYGNTVVYGPTATTGRAMERAVQQTCGEGGYSCVAFPRYPVSDDRSFQAAGIPTVSLATVTAPEAHQMWLMLNAGPTTGLTPDFTPRVLSMIHTSADTPDKLDPAAMSLAYQVVLDLVVRLDRTPPR